MTLMTEGFLELRPFVAAVEKAYQGRLAGLYLFGSRARGDARPDSDYDVAVVLDEETRTLWQEVNGLADLALEALLSTGIEIQAVPFRSREWNQPARSITRAARRDAVILAEFP